MPDIEESEMSDISDEGSFDDFEMDTGTFSHYACGAEIALTRHLRDRVR